MLAAHTMIGAERPSLEIGEDAKNDVRVRPVVLDEKRFAPAAVADDEIWRKAFAPQGHQQLRDRQSARDALGVMIDERLGFEPFWREGIGPRRDEGRTFVLRMGHGHKLVPPRLFERVGDKKELAGKILVNEQNAHDLGRN